MLTTRLYTWQLKGIGKQRAKRLIQLREENGIPLGSLDDLAVIGMTHKQIQKLYDDNAAELPSTVLALF